MTPKSGPHGPGSGLGLFLVCSGFCLFAALQATALPLTSWRAHSRQRGPRRKWAGEGSLTRPYSHQQKSNLQLFLMLAKIRRLKKDDCQIFRV